MFAVDVSVRRPSFRRDGVSEKWRCLRMLFVLEQWACVRAGGVSEQWACHSSGRVRAVGVCQSSGRVRAGGWSEKGRRVRVWEVYAQRTRLVGRGVAEDRSYVKWQCVDKHQNGGHNSIGNIVGDGRAIEE